MPYNQKLLNFLNGDNSQQNPEKMQDFLNMIMDADGNDAGLSKSLLESWKSLANFPSDIDDNDVLSIDGEGVEPELNSLSALKEAAIYLQVDLMEHIRQNQTQGTDTALDIDDKEEPDFASMTPNKIKAYVFEQLKNLKQQFDPVEMRGSHTYRTLVKLKNSSVEEWLNPAFMTKARREAKGMKENYQNLARGCAVVVEQLKNHQQELNRLLEKLKSSSEVPEDDKFLDGIGDHLPTIDEKGIASLIAIVERRLLVVDNALKVYEPAMEKLKVILPAIEKAKHSNEAIVGIESNNWSTVSVHVDKNKIDSPATNSAAVSVETGVKDDKQDVNKPSWKTSTLDTNKSRRFSVEYHDRNDQSNGSFVEQYRAINPSSASTKDRSDVPFAKVTVEQFPRGNDEACVNFSMMMARQLLASTDQVPSKKNPIVLRGTDNTQLEYLWTALMILGKNTLDMRFGQEAIVVKSKSLDATEKPFNPKTQLNWRGKFSADSCFESKFEPHQSIYGQSVSEFRLLAAAKFGHDKEGKKLHGDMTTVFKDKQQEMLRRAQDGIGTEDSSPERDESENHRLGR